MEIQEIEVIVGKDGKVELSVRGVKGSACLDITRALETVLGGVVLERESTPEMLEEPDPNRLSNGDQISAQQGGA
jgi:hypothetical protein